MGGVTTKLKWTEQQIRMKYLPQFSKKAMIELEIKTALIIALYVTGDTHGALDIRKLNTTNFPAQNKMSKADYVAILGDFGHFHADEQVKKNYRLLYNDILPI